MFLNADLLSHQLTNNKQQHVFSETVSKCKPVIVFQLSHFASIASVWTCGHLEQFVTRQLSSHLELSGELVLAVEMCANCALIFRGF